MDSDGVILALSIFILLMLPYLNWTGMRNYVAGFFKSQRDPPQE